MFQLVMQPAKGSLPRIGMVVLDEGIMNAEVGKLRLMVSLKEKARASRNSLGRIS